MKRRIMKNSLLAFFVFSLTYSYSQEYLEKVDTVRELIIDQQILVGELSLHPQKGEVEGQFTLVFETLDKPSDSLWLDAPNVRFLEVLYDGKPVDHKVYPRGLSVLPKIQMNSHELHKITFHYIAEPRKGMFFIGWDDESGRKQIWTQGQGIDNRHWLPMVDDQNDKLLWDVTLEFDADYLVLSNGERLVEEEVGHGLKKWRYSVHKPMSPYLIMIGVGEYSEKKHSSISGIPLENYIYPDQEDRRSTTYFKSTELFDWMESLLTPFPWEKYSQIPVRDFHHGAMENTSATIFGDFYVEGQRAAYDKPYLEINAHELAHQWFGNWQTSTNATHHWLHEGFATYFQWEAVRVFLGEELYRDRLEEARSQIYSAESDDGYPLCHPKAGSARFYQKGGWVITLLADKMGRENFYLALREYLTSDHSKNKTTEDFFQIAEKHSGLNLETFKNYWCYGNLIGHVNLKVEEGRFSISAIDIPEKGITVPVQFFLPNNTIEKSIEIFPGKPYTEELPEGVINVLIYPGKRTLLKVTEDKDLAMWNNQLDHSLPIDEELAFSKITSSLEGDLLAHGKLILKVLNEPYGVRTQRMASHFAGILYPDIEVEPWFYKVKSSVRESFVNKDLTIRTEDFDFFKKSLLDSSELVVRSFTKALGPINAKEVYEITGAVTPSADGSLFFIRTMQILNAENKDEIFDLWIDKTSPNQNFLVRQTAFEILDYYKYYTDQVIFNLVQASCASNRRLRNSSRKILEKVDKESAERQIKIFFDNHQEIANWRKLWFEKTFDLDL